MKKILAFSGSNSSTSINHKLLEYIQQTFQLENLELISLKSLKVPMFGVDDEKNGFPAQLVTLQEAIQSADILLIASPEHNGNMTSYLKSTLDWLSRINRDFLLEKPVFIVGTSPGRGGAMSSIENLKKFVTRLKGNVIQEFSLPSFNHSFENGKLVDEFQSSLNQFIDALKNYNGHL